RLLRLLAVERPERDVLEAVREATEVTDHGVEAHRLVEQLRRLAEGPLDPLEKAGGFGKVRMQERSWHPCAQLAQRRAVLQCVLERSELELPEDQPPQAAPH